MFDVLTTYIICSLTRQEILSELLDLILHEPAEDVEERLRFKLPNIASEVITCDVAQVRPRLGSPIVFIILIINAAD